MLQASFLLPIRKVRILPYQPQCMTQNVANSFSHSHFQGGSHTQPNSRAWFKMLQSNFSFPLARGESYPTNFQCITPNNVEEEAHCYVVQCRRIHSLWEICSRSFNNWMQDVSARRPSSVGVLPNQSPVHDSKCCKRLLSFPLARVKSYPTKLQYTTINAANVLSHSH